MKILNELARASGRRARLLKSRDIYKPLLFSSLAILVGFLCGLGLVNGDVFAQSNAKNISLGSQSVVAPQVKIKQALVGGKLRKFDENFREDSDWIRRASFKVENVSGKGITYLRINVFFPETKASGPVMVYPVSLGQRPGSKLLLAEPLHFDTNDTLDISLADRQMEISRFLSERHTLESINQIRLEVAFIVFEDGSAWSVGTFMKQDPNNPDRYVPVEPTPPGSKH